MTEAKIIDIKNQLNLKRTTMSDENINFCKEKLNTILKNTVDENKIV